MVFIGSTTQCTAACSLDGSTTRTETPQERVVWFTFEDAAIRHLQGRIERGE